MREFIVAIEGKMAHFKGNDDYKAVHCLYLRAPPSGGCGPPYEVAHPRATFYKT